MARSPQSTERFRPGDERALIEAGYLEAQEWQRAAGGPGPWPTLPPPETFPGYDVLREIHRGGQGVVYEALQRSTNRLVAIKVMLEGPFAGENSKLRFEREVQVVASLRHPNIVVIHDSGIARGQHYFIMDLVRGQQLDTHVQLARLRVPEVVRLVTTVTRALAHTHARNIVHRDLKPSNILVDDDGVPYVLDFGLAKTSPCELGGGQSATLSGQVLGTLRYMSPEQAAGSLDLVDARTDVYALGVILYELLTGKRPYNTDGDLSGALERIRTCQPTPPSRICPDVDNDLERIICTAMQKSPTDRYLSATELTQALEAWLSRPASGDSSTKSADRPRRIGYIVASVAVLAGLATVIYWVPLRTRSVQAPAQVAGGAEALGGAREDDLDSLSSSSGDMSQEEHAPGQPQDGGLELLLDHVSKNLPLKTLRLEPVPGERRLRISGPVLNDQEMAILVQRLDTVEHHLQLEVMIDPEAVRLAVQRALTEAGAQDVRVRIEEANGVEHLTIQFTRTPSLSPEQAETIAHGYVLNPSGIKLRAH